MEDKTCRNDLSSAQTCLGNTCLYVQVKLGNVFNDTAGSRLTGIYTLCQHF